MTVTETELREWRFGALQAERLAASILRLEKFQNIEPQAPLGGPDDGADILCDRGGRYWVAAVYFPPTGKEFKEVKEKFEHDLKGALRHKRHGIVFLTNQRLKRSERSELVNTALAAKQECLIYDVERLRGVLDSPEGYGVRVGYLRITMSPEEQIAYFASRESALEGLISKNVDYLQSLAVQISSLRSGQAHVAASMNLIAKAHSINVEPLRVFDPLATGEVLADKNNASVLANLTPALVLLAHRLVCFELPPRLIGRFRTEAVFIQKASAAPGSPTITPPAPDQVPQLVEQLCKDWNARYPAVKDPRDALALFAEFFHRILTIHPFLDGNGRVARSLLMQQCVEYFGHADMSLFDRGAAYYAALQAADAGDLKPLAGLIETAVSG